MARAFSLFLAFGLCALGSGQSFGRFGYKPADGVPGWKITPRGFQSNTAVSDAFAFVTPTAQWKPSETSAVAQTVELGDAADGQPTRLKMDLAAPGFSLYFPKGIDLQIGTISAPYLSWAEGSVEDGVSTPPCPWILVSFRQSQPPILFSFPDTPQGMVISGEPGRWHLRTLEPMSGWVRVLLPLGLEARSTSTASDLGELVKKIVGEEALWSGSAPTLLDTKVVTDPGGIVATWTYDKPGALVPQAALLATFGGYPLHILTKIRQLESTSAEGPMAVTTEPSLSIRFPIIAWPQGKYLALSSEPNLSVTEPSQLDVAEAVNTTFQILAANPQGTSVSDAGSHLMAFLSHTNGDAEPFTNMRLPYSVSGSGYELTAAHALLTEGLDVANGSPDLQNPLLAQMQARVDAYNWRPWGMDEQSWRRAACLGSISYAMRTKPEDRLLGAMLQAGLCAQRGLDLWHHWRGDLTTLPEHLEVMDNLRRKIFSQPGPPTSDPGVDCILSPVRFFGGGQIETVSRGGKIFLKWMAIDATATDLQLTCPAGTKFAAADNIQKLTSTLSGDITTLHCVPIAAGFCELRVTLTSGASLPEQVAQLYAEASR